TLSRSVMIQDGAPGRTEACGQIHLGDDPSDELAEHLVADNNLDWRGNRCSQGRPARTPVDTISRTDAQRLICAVSRYWVERARDNDESYVAQSVDQRRNLSNGYSLSHSAVDVPSSVRS